MTRRIVAAALMLLCAACTQPPAEVEYKGNEFYGRDHGALDAPSHETFAANSERYKPGYTRPVEPAPVPAVAVADLSPPVAVHSTNLPPPPNTPQAQPRIVNAPPAVAQLPQTASVAAPIASSRFIWPVMGGKVISHFGTKAGGHANDGINIAIDEGEPILAAADGTVIYAGSDLKGYGNMVILRHDGGWMTAYAHARQLAANKGDVVKQGKVIAYVGTTGGVKGPQLHFVVRNGKTPVDPEQYLPRAHS